MFYRIINNELYDYADYKYADDCEELKDHTMNELAQDHFAFTVQDGKLVYSKDTDEYAAKRMEYENKLRENEIRLELSELDNKRIRALCEPEIKNADTGETWLDFYNSQILELRKELMSLI